MQLYNDEIIITWQICFAYGSYSKGNCHTNLAHNELKHIFKAM